MDEGKVRILKDMLGTQIAVNDVVVYPGGNARYGGLKMIVGVVVKMTEKRMTLLGGPIVFDEKAFKSTSKTGAKVLLCNDNNVLVSPAVRAIRKQLEEQQ